MKVLTVVGTRPEIIRLSCTLPRLDANFDHVLVHTGQNYDPELSDVFFSDLRLRSPDYFLGVDTSTLGHVLGHTLIEIESILEKERPDAMLVLGDTNSCIAAIMAKRLHIPVYHMEAGNRSFDENVPEETNRRMIDHVADFNLVYTEHARRNLLAEGLHPRRILLTGSPMLEVLNHFKPDIAKSAILRTLALDEKKFFLVSAHRQENVDEPHRLAALIACVRAVAERYKLPVVVSTHPRTRKRLEDLGDGSLVDQDIRFLKPFGFHDYIRLQLDAACVLSDSGTVAEEASILGFPAVTLRDAIERPEALDTGSIITTGLEVQDVLRAVEMVMSEPNDATRPLPPGYEVDDASVRTVRFIQSTANRHHAWAGIRQSGRRGCAE